MADEALKNPLSMSDEEISNMSGPPEGGAPETDEERATREAAEEAAETARLDALDVAAGKPAADDDDPDKGDDDLEETEAEKAARLADEDDPDPADDKIVEPKPGDDPAGSKPKADEPVVEDDKEKTKPGDKPAEIALPDQTALANFYNQIMTPFKANGKLIELKTPEEAISLMQMGANYTRKLQDIQPHRKMLLMLENNGLLDEGKLSFLIDLDKKDPEAIKKLVKESGIDPLDIDTDNVTYLPGDHSVTDDEASFRSTMGDLIKSDPEGQKTVSEIYETWDDASKEVLWKQPDIMTAIHEQRSTGVYDRIKAEVDRLTTLGQIPPNTPFLQAYKAVGDAMVEEATAANGGDDPEPPKVVTTRAATPKSKLKDGDKANAASPTRGSPKVAGKLVNPLAMKDEDFLKDMEGRL